MKTWTKRTIAVCLLLALFLTAIPCASAKQYTDVTRSALPDTLMRSTMLQTMGS